MEGGCSSGDATPVPGETQEDTVCWTPADSSSSDGGGGRETPQAKPGQPTDTLSMSDSSPNAEPLPGDSAADRRRRRRHCIGLRRDIARLPARVWAKLKSAGKKLPRWLLSHGERVAKYAKGFDLGECNTSAGESGGQGDDASGGMNVDIGVVPVYM